MCNVVYVCNPVYHILRPNGRIDFAVSLPDEPISWSLGGFSVSQDWGFGIVYDIHMVGERWLPSFLLSWLLPLRDEQWRHALSCCWHSRCCSVTPRIASPHQLIVNAFIHEVSLQKLLYMWYKVCDHLTKWLPAFDCMRACALSFCCACVRLI